MLHKEMPRFYIFFLLLISAGTGRAWAQNPCFNADTLRGCAPLTVTLSDCSGSDDILYDFGQGFVNDSVFTYENPGLYSIRQVINSDGGGADTTYTDYIEVFAPQIPEYALSICTGNGILLQNQDTHYDFLLFDMGDGSPLVEVRAGDQTVHTYPNDALRQVTVTGGFDGGGGSCGGSQTTVQPQAAIPPADFQSLIMADAGNFTLSFNFPDLEGYILQEQVNGGGFNTVDTLAIGRQSFEVTGRDAEASTYCYRIVYNTPCDGGTIVSEELCTTWLTATPQNDTIMLEWTPFQGGIADFGEYRINGGGIDNAISDNTYAEVVTECGSFCYDVTILLASGAFVRSPTQCAAPMLSHPPPTPLNLLVTAEGEDHIVSWDLPPGHDGVRVFMEITVSGMPSQELLLPIEEPYVHEGGANGITTCYAIVLEDSCGVRSQSPAFMCPAVFDSARSSKTEEGNNQLVWRGFTNFPQPQLFELEVYDEDMNLLEVITVGGRDDVQYLHDLSDIGNQGLYYRIVTSNTDRPDFVAYSHFFYIPPADPEQIELPDAFTPNADGLNDSFRAYTPAAQRYEMRIYNRWGELLFFSEDREVGWDGTYQGQQVPGGYYSCAVRMIDAAGRELEKEAIFLLIRD